MGRKLSGGLELRLDGGETFVKEMRQAAKEVRSEFVNEGRDIARGWGNESRRAMPRQSGDARRSMRHFAKGNRSGMEAGLRSGLVYGPALHYGTRGRFGSTMTSRYGRAPRFAYDVRRRRKTEWSERLLEVVVQAALTVSALRRG